MGSVAAFCLVTTNPAPEALLSPRLSKLLAAALAACLALAAAPASAQVRVPGGLPGAGQLGPSGPSLGTPSLAPNIQPVSPNIPAADDVRSSLPRLDTPVEAGKRATDTVTNSLGGALGTVPATVGRATDIASPLARNPLQTPQAGRSGVPPAGERRFVDREVVVSLPSTLTPEALEAVARRHRLVRLQSETVELTGTAFHRWRIADGRSVREVIRALEADAGVQAAQPNYRYTLQQGEGPRAARAHRAQYTVYKLNLPDAHRFATGDKVLVAVIDSGVDTAHPELAGAIAGSFDALNSSEPAHQHGTAIAGAIAAHATLTGTAPAARILAIRAFNSSGASAEGTTLTLLKSLDWAIARGARIINMSFAGPYDPQIARALTAARRRGVVLVAAAGNAGPNAAPLYPAADPNVIAVAATDSEDKLFPQSSRGRHVAIAAPGSDIIVPVDSGGYQSLSGTSFAAAHVSGVVALLLQVKPSLSPEAVTKILLSTAKDLGPKGRDDQFGAGLADAYGAILSLSPEVAAAKPLAAPLRLTTGNRASTPPAATRPRAYGVSGN